LLLTLFSFQVRICSDQRILNDLQTTITVSLRRRLPEDVVSAKQLSLFVSRLKCVDLSKFLLEKR